MKKILSSVFSFLMVFSLLTQQALALSIIPSAMKKSEPTRQTTSQVLLEKKQKNEKELWKTFFSLKEKGSKEKINASIDLDIYINAEDIIFDLSGQIKIVADMLKRKIEESVSGSLNVTEIWSFFDEEEEKRESSIAGLVNLKIIDNDFFLNIEDFSLKGEAEEAELFLSTLFDKWLHFNFEEKLGINLWENNEFEIMRKEMIVNSPEDLELIFINLLSQEAGLDRLVASEIVSMFSFKEIFYISNDNNHSLKLSLNKEKVKYAVIKAANLLGEKLSKDEIAEMNDFLKNFVFEITFDYEKLNKKVNSIGFHLYMKEFDSLNELKVNLKINYLDFNSAYEILPPAEYVDFEEAIKEAEQAERAKWEEEWETGEEWKFDEEEFEL